MANHRHNLLETRTGTSTYEAQNQGAITVYISVTFIVYAILLDKLWTPEGIDLWLTTISHYVTPLAFIIDWAFFEERHTYQWRYAIHWLVYPFFYLLYNQVYGQITGRYLYPFLNVPDIGWSGLAFWVLGLSGFFVLLSAIYIYVNKKLGA
jgi:hypothetical protein